MQPSLLSRRFTKGRWAGGGKQVYKSFNTLCNKQPSLLSRRFTKGRWAGGGKQVAPPTLEGIARDGRGRGAAWASINHSILSDKQSFLISRRFTKGRWAGKQVAPPTLEGIARDGRGGALSGPL
jgi:hypothetical protein